MEWLKNDETLKLEADKYDLIGNGSELRIHKISYADTGAYMCQANNKGGLTRDISSLIVQQEPTPSKSVQARYLLVGKIYFEFSLTNIFFVRLSRIVTSCDFILIIVRNI